MSTTSSCGCSAAPCSCSSGGGVSGCIGDACVPRPRFFNGQLLTSDDFNALETYSRTADAMFARFTSGWGILGGLRVTAAPGVPSVPLTDRTVSPNPSFVYGTTLQISAGAGVDSLGRRLVVCSPLVIDVLALAAKSPGAPTTHSCPDWFSPLTGVCTEDPPADLTATEYWVIAEFVEGPSRPVPRFSGGGACDPAPSCDFSRVTESVRISLSPTRPDEFTACLGSDVTPPPLSFPGPTGREYIVQEWLDRLNELQAELCCGRPVLVLAKIMVLNTLVGAAAPAPAGVSPPYVIVQDGYPDRRPVVTTGAASEYFARLIAVAP